MDFKCHPKLQFLFEYVKFLLGEVLYTTPWSQKETVTVV